MCVCVWFVREGVAFGVCVRVGVREWVAFVAKRVCVCWVVRVAFGGVLV